MGFKKRAKFDKMKVDSFCDFGKSNPEVQLRQPIIKSGGSVSIRMGAISRGQNISGNSPRALKMLHTDTGLRSKPIIDLTLYFVDNNEIVVPLKRENLPTLTDYL